MANSLLDFVISLVRDPEAAARYAANPGQAIADAHLTDVTSTDVNNLIPVVSDSLSMAAPTASVVGAPVVDHGNVWASGAATAAFDAFTPHVAAGVVPPHDPTSVVINQPAVHVPNEVPDIPQPAGIGHFEPAGLVTGGGMPDLAFDHGAFPVSDPGIWDHSVIHPDTHPHEGAPDHHGFDIHG